MLDANTGNTLSCRVVHLCWRGIMAFSPHTHSSLQFVIGTLHSKSQATLQTDGRAKASD